MTTVYVVASALLFACCCWEYWRVMQWLRAASLAIGEGPARLAGSVKKPLDAATDRH